MPCIFLPYAINPNPGITDAIPISQISRFDVLNSLTYILFRQERGSEAAKQTDPRPGRVGRMASRPLSLQLRLSQSMSDPIRTLNGCPRQLCSHVVFDPQNLVELPRDLIGLLRQ